MSDRTAIEWADASWNPTTGCEKVSPGCDGCYAIRTAARFQDQPAYAGTVHRTPAGLDWTGTVRTLPDRLDAPLRWRKPRRIFVNSMSDLFHDAVPDEFIARVWQAMGAAPHHTYQVLTKRHARMRSWVTQWYAGDIAEPYDVRPVPGYPGYFVTTTGDVLGKRSDTRTGLAQEVGEQGHRRVAMHREGSPRSGSRELVHRLVLAAFARAPRLGEQGCHRNGDPSDNRLSNLYWGTQQDNWRDRIRHGNGRSHAKLTEQQVDEIRGRLAAGGTASAIAPEYGVSDTQIRNIALGRHWAAPKATVAAERPCRAVLDSVWLGVSVEDQHWADIRIPALLDTPAAVRWISAEPLLGPVRLRTGVYEMPGAGPVGTSLQGIDWVVAGGESGPGARPMHPDWARQLRDQCAAAGVPYLYKQTGEWAPAPWHGHDGATHAFTGSLRADGTPHFMRLGHTPTSNERDLTTPAGAQGMRKLGKKAAGRELDGFTWDQYPATEQPVGVR